jgi:hypothetical protein
MRKRKVSRSPAQWDDGMKGMQHPHPMREREYVTLTGYDSVQDMVTFKENAKGGKTGWMGNKSIDAGAVKPPPLEKPARPADVLVKPAPNKPAEQLQEFDPGKDLSMPTGDEFGVKQVATTAQAIGSQTNYLKQRDTNYAKAQMALEGVNFMLDVMNANNAYHAATGQAQFNIMMARNQAADALYRGRQAQGAAQSEGRMAGQDALLGMAAQGQDTGGAAAQKVQGSYDAMGVMAGMQHEINSIREALGHELEEVNYNWQMKQARVTRDNQIIGSGLKLGAKAATLGMM